MTSNLTSNSLQPASLLKDATTNCKTTIEIDMNLQEIDRVGEMVLERSTRSPVVQAKAYKFQNAPIHKSREDSMNRTVKRKSRSPKKVVDNEPHPEHFVLKPSALNGSALISTRTNLSRIEHNNHWEDKRLRPSFLSHRKASHAEHL